MARVLERKKRRLACDLRFGGQRFTGLVLDLSPTGLYIQTSARGKPGDVFDMELSVPREAQLLSLQVQVVRKNVVPARLRSIAQGGVGVRIINAAEGYYSYLAALRVEAGSLGAGLAPGGAGAGVDSSTASAASNTLGMGCQVPSLTISFSASTGRGPSS